MSQDKCDIKLEKYVSPIMTNFVCDSMTVSSSKTEQP